MNQPVEYQDAPSERNDDDNEDVDECRHVKAPSSHRAQSHRHGFSSEISEAKVIFGMLSIPP
jgi:hypothetical protein